MTRLDDARARERAATDFTSNLVVVAGAGTGKTSLLVERYLNLLLSRRVAPEQVVALTFSEKAAGEMKDRVAGSVDRILRILEEGAEVPGEESEVGRSLAWLRGRAGIDDTDLAAAARDLNDALGSAAITTIHAFCSDLLRRNALEAKLPLEFTADEGTAQELLFDEEWPRYLAAELGPDPERPAEWNQVLDRFQEASIEDVARKLTRVPALLDSLEHDGYLAPDPAPEQEDGKPVEEEAFAALVGVLRPFADRFRARVRRDGALAFEDLLVLARNVLRDSADVRRREANRARVLLVDEFQDTDPLQYEILFYLAARDTGPIRDPYQAELEPGRLFIVGDPKQSIYRFRGADMDAYRRAVEHVLGDEEPLTLVTNFRSRPAVLRPVNRLFEGWIGPRSTDDRSIEPEYHPVHPFRKDEGEGPRVELLTVTTGAGTRAEFRRPAEARALASLIRGWIDDGAWEQRDVAILFRALTDVPTYLRELRRAGIDTVVDGGRAFADRPEVVESFALLQALANPADPVATLGVLRSTFGAVPDAELHRYASAGGRFRWNRPGVEALETAPAVRAVYDRLYALRKERRRVPLDRWVERVLLTDLFPVLQGAYFEGSQRMANVQKLAERIGGLVRDRGLSLERAIRTLREEFEGLRAEGDSPLADESVDAVRLLTVHKAKGLEFPVVILPDLARRSPNDPYETRVACMRDGARIYPAIKLKEAGVPRNRAGLLEEAERRKHEQAETKRLLYVAMTRARERLVLSNTATTSLGDWVKQIQKAWGYAIEKNIPPDGLLVDGLVTHRVVNGDEETAGSAAPVSLDLAPAVRAFERAREAAGRERTPRFRTPSQDHRALEADRHADPGADEAPLSRDEARSVGIAAHLALERWDFSSPDALLPLVPAAAASAAAETGVDAGPIRREAELIVRGFADSPTARELAGAEILARELPILLRDDSGAVVHG